MTGFGLGAIAEMALAAGAAGAALRVIFGPGRTRRGPALVTGDLSITVGVMRPIPLWSRR